MTTVRFYCYISTGALSAMFTLWVGRESDDPKFNRFIRDRYVCNLAGIGNDELAETKARDYAERMSDRMGTDVQFGGFYDEPRNLRRGKLSVRDTHSLELIEKGIFPFGKHSDAEIITGDDGYILYWADKHADESPVIAALAAACMGVAMERDLMAKRDAARAEREALDAASEYVGAIGERREFCGEIVSAFFKSNHYEGGDEQGYWITRIRCDGNLITYFGNELAKRGETIRFKATVKAHCEYKGVKSTKVNRPKVIA